MTKQDTQERKLRTRTFIQLGGGVKLSGLMDAFNIFEGEDLQSNPEGYDKSAALVGFLDYVREKFLDNHTPLEIEKYKKIGVSLLKQAAAKRVY